MSRRTYARFDPAALRHNLEVARRAAPGATFAAVVKADGYGHGLDRVAPALAPGLDDGPEGDLFAVATTAEARQLRGLGWDGRILLLEGVSHADGLDQARALCCELVIHHATQLALLRQREGGADGRYWLKIDSGMNRLGFVPGEAAAARAALMDIADRAPVLMTHFACADDPASALTAQQVETFTALTGDWAGPRSLCNSAALLAHPDAHGDIVRPGIMLYGASPMAGETGGERDLRPAMTLVSELIALKRCPAGATVGYGGAWRCPEDMPIGVAAIGYGDGYPRHARNGTPVLVNGHRAAIVGRVSMDMVTIDLRAVPGAGVGDPVVLWGEGLPVEVVADHADAIAWQLLCGVTARVPFETR